MLSGLVAHHETGDWTGAYFFADLIADQESSGSGIWFRANDNGISFGFSVEEWMMLDALFRRAWTLPEIRRSLEALALEYGEL